MQHNQGAQPAVFLDRDGTIVWISDNVTEVLGWAPDEMVGRGGAEPILNWLGALLDRRLLGIDVRYRARHRITAYGITREVGNEEEDATGLRLILGSDPPGPADSAEVALVRYAGCWWISETGVPTP